MVSTGDTAPAISATLGTADHESFDLSEHLGEGPVVLAFFPGAFTPPCTSEMDAIQERIREFEDAGATVLGVSKDSAFAQDAFREARGLDFELVSDTDGDTIRDYGVEIDIPDLGLYGVANRAVFVLDAEGRVTYEWVADDPTTEPDYDAVLEAVRAAAS